MNKILFSERLREQRKKCGYDSITDFAKKYNETFPAQRRDRKDENKGNYCGILGTLKNYENPNKECKPRLDIVDNLCKLLSCDTDYLLGNMECETHDIQFIHDKTGLSKKAIEILMHWNEIGSSPSSSYAWARNSIKVISDLIEQEIYLSEDVLNPIANYIYYRSIFESPSYTRHERNMALDKFRLSLFTATNGLTDCIKAIYKDTKKAPDTN